MRTKNKQSNKAFLMAGSYLDMKTAHQCGKVTCPKHVGNWALKYHLPCFLPLRCSGLCELVHTSDGVLYAIGQQLCHSKPKKGVGAAKM